MFPTATAGSHRPITIRAVTPADAPALHDLHESLDLDERHRRFFGAFHPPLAFCAGLATVAARGGMRVVAVADRPHAAGGGTVVGEAGCEPLGPGEGELTLTVPRAWRPAAAAPLLDAVLEQAAAAGFTNVEIDVLRSDRSLRSLLRARGAVVAGRDGWRSSRLRVGTTHGGPTWPAGSPRRVLVELAGGHWPSDDELLAELGAERADERAVRVLVCPGPHGSVCPVLAGQPCSLAADADQIVVAAGVDGTGRALVAAHGDVHPGVAVRTVY